MTPQQIEAAAKAIRTTRFQNMPWPSWESLSDKFKTRYREEAQAALKAAEELGSSLGGTRPRFTVVDDIA